MKRRLILLLPLFLVCGIAHGAEEALTPLTSVQRLETAHLKAAQEAAQQFARARQQIPNLTVYEDYRAVLHVHAEDSDHTKGTRPEVLAAAKKKGVRVVGFTDHRGPKPETWRGLKDGVLFLAGAEESSGSLRFPLFSNEGAPLTENELRFICHVEERYDADSTGYVGMEICNRHTDAKLDEKSLAHLMATSTNADAWSRLVADFKAFPDAFFAAGTDYRSEIFSKWDRELGKRHFVGIGANDAHQNTILKEVTFDPYEVSFRNLCTHILARELTEADIRHSLINGHVYVSHDWLCDPTGFLFLAGNNLGLYTMGDSIPFVGKTRIYAKTPVPAKLKLIHNGKVIQETFAAGLTNVAEHAGAYRLEAWLTVDGEDRPWIYSNAIYVETPTLDALRLPSMELSATVERIQDLAYIDKANEPKHKLDIYRHKETKSAPVLFFVHGGAWKTGDRAQYVPLGNRFARDGIVTVIPSYRLAPQNPHPAQIEDVAAAFAWTVKHIGEYGGDTKRIYLSGHSAGGHLVALLALEPRFLQKYELSPASMRGVFPLSGVFDLTEGEGQSSVFGRELQGRRDASPLYHVKKSAPSFVVGYCEWDYPLLPAQAKQFHAALVRDGVSSKEIYIPERSHISEMLGIDRDHDPTAVAILNFVRGDTKADHPASP